MIRATGRLVRATAGSAGLDLENAGPPVRLAPYGWATIATGVTIEIPEGHVGLVRGRSGLAFKHRVFAFEGTIDSDYRGEIKVLLHNAGIFPFMVDTGMRIAQLVIVPYLAAEIVSAEPAPTDRGGFGSTGL